MKRRARVLIGGQVQGVFFRAHTQRKARELGLTGWVRNRPDGCVEAVFEGEEEAIQQAIAWCHRGPSEARVERVEVEWQDSQGDLEGFYIRRE